jgi:hypothetical protein
MNSRPFLTTVMMEIFGVTVKLEQSATLEHRVSCAA